MKWSVIDPLGFEHIVEQQDDHAGYWGTENLAHCVDDLMQRPYVVSSLLYHMDKQQEQGQWEGYVWKKV